MTSSPLIAPQVWAVSITAYEQRLKALANEVHLDWLEPLKESSFQASINWQDLACFLDVAKPPWTDFANPTLRLALLTPDQVKRVLVMRALLDKRWYVRTCINPNQRAELTSAVGSQALCALMHERHDTGTIDTRGVFKDIHSLSWEGYQLFATDGSWQDDAGLARLLRLRFPKVSLPSLGRSSDPMDSFWVLKRLHLLLKEQSCWYDSIGTTYMSTWK